MLILGVNSCSGFSKKEIVSDFPEKYRELPKDCLDWAATAPVCGWEFVIANEATNLCGDNQTCKKDLLK